MGKQLPPTGQDVLAALMEGLLLRYWLTQGQSHWWVGIDEMVLHSRLRRPPHPGLCPAALHASRTHASQSSHIPERPGASPERPGRRSRSGSGQDVLAALMEGLLLRYWLTQGQSHWWVGIDEMVLHSRLRRPPHPGLCPAALHASRTHASQSSHIPERPGASPERPGRRSRSGSAAP